MSIRMSILVYPFSQSGDRPQKGAPVHPASICSGLRLSLALQSQSLQAIGLSDRVRDRQSPNRTFWLGAQALKYLVSLNGYIHVEQDRVISGSSTRQVPAEREYPRLSRSELRSLFLQVPGIGNSGGSGLDTGIVCRFSGYLSSPEAQQI